MMVDSITLLDDSKIERKVATVVSMLPTTAVPKTLVELKSNPTLPTDGIYIRSYQGTWILVSSNLTGAYDIGVSVFDRPKSNDIVAKHLFIRSIVFESGFKDSLAASTVAATDSVIFKIEIDENTVTSQIGTLTFAPGSKIGVFASTFTEPRMVGRGALLKITSPLLRDSTLSNIDITFAGQLLAVAV